LSSWLAYEIVVLCVSIPLPKWVVEEINNDNDLAYTDQWGRRNYEYVSLGCDTLPVLKGRTPVQCYADFMRAFRDTFKHLLGDTIVVYNCHPFYTNFLSELSPHAVIFYALYLLT